MSSLPYLGISRVCDQVRKIIFSRGQCSFYNSYYSLIRSIDERTLVFFCENSPELLKAYVESGEGIDRAGGFAIQGQGGLLIRKIEGDYQNVVGFPAASFFQFLELLADEDEDFLEI